MHEELRIALEQISSHVREPGWLIPVLITHAEVPALPIGDGRTLRDIQWVDFTSDWNTAIRKLLRIIRPATSHTRAIESWFRELCELHVESHIDRAWSTGAFRVRQVEDSWRSLLLPSRWDPTLDGIVRLFERVKVRKVPLTEKWVESTDTGITILTTISPTASIDLILKSLRGQSHSISFRKGNVYEDFVRTERKKLRYLANWPKRDLAHWIFALDGDDVTVDLLYWTNLKLTLLVYGLILEKQREDRGTGPIETMYPGSILTATEFENMLMKVCTEEVRLLEKSG